MKSYTNKGIRLAALITSTLAVGGVFALAPAAHADYGVAPSPVINEACGGNRYSTDCMEEAWNYDEENQVQPITYQYPPHLPYPAYNYNPSYYSNPAPVYNNYVPTDAPTYISPEPAYNYPTTSYYDYDPTAYNTSSYSYQYADSYNYNYSNNSNDCNSSYDSSCFAY